MFRPIDTAKVSFTQLKLDAIWPDKYRSAYRGELRLLRLEAGGQRRFVRTRHG